jgi:hypothetical protein
LESSGFFAGDSCAPLISDLQEPPQTQGNSLSTRLSWVIPNKCVYGLFTNLLRDFYAFSQVIGMNPENAAEAEWPLSWNA